MIKIEVDHISTSHNTGSNPTKSIVVTGRAYLDYKLEDGTANVSTRFEVSYNNSPNGILKYADSKINKELTPEHNKTLALFIKDEVMKAVRHYVMNDYRKMIYQFFDKFEVKKS